MVWDSGKSAHSSRWYVYLYAFSIFKNKFFKDDPNEKCRIEDDILESKQELRETEFIIRNLIGTFLIIVEDAKILGLIQWAMNHTMTTICFEQMYERHMRSANK